MSVTQGAGFAAAARDGLAALTDPVAAPAMQRYMRSALPFRGVPTPARRRLLADLVAAHPLDRDSWAGAARDLWDGAAFREERYLAVSLTGHRRFARFAAPDLLPLYRAWIVQGAWWDHVDEIASRRVGPLLREHPDAVRPVVRGWAHHEDPWLRRTAVICQLGSGAATDVALLVEAIEASIDDRDFFLRKAIGWALRQHTRTDPGWVRAFVDDHPELSALSRREALRHLGPPPG